MVEPTHLKIISQNGNLPEVGMKIKKYLKPPPSFISTPELCSLLNDDTIFKITLLGTNIFPMLLKKGEFYYYVSLTVVFWPKERLQVLLLKKW